MARPRSPVDPCRICTEPIRWVKTRAGKSMPVNPTPNPTHGNVAALPTGQRFIDGVVVNDNNRDAMIAAGYTIFTAHFATCEARPPKPEQPSLF